MLSILFFSRSYSSYICWTNTKPLCTILKKKIVFFLSDIHSFIPMKYLYSNALLVNWYTGSGVMHLHIFRAWKNQEASVGRTVHWTWATEEIWEFIKLVSKWLKQCLHVKEKIWQDDTVQNKCCTNIKHCTVSSSLMKCYQA